MNYSCFYCGSVYTSYIHSCSVCCRDKTLLAVPEGKNYLVRPERKGTISACELRSQEIKGRTVKGFEKLGLLPTSWRLLVYGLPGNGKSRFCLKFSQAYYGKVLYVACEEGFGATMKKKLVMDEITGENIIISDAMLKWELDKDIAEVSPDLLIIDSISAAKDESMVDMSLEMAQIWVAHVTKDARFKGDSSVAHNVDIILRIENGVLFVEKNRFNMAGIEIPLENWEVLTT